jgi:hypothetical protein
MIRADRELLARLVTVNQSLGEVVLRMLAHQDGGELDAADLQTVGRQLTALGSEMLRRAAAHDPAHAGHALTICRSLYRAAAR